MKNKTKQTERAVMAFGDKRLPESFWARAHIVIAAWRATDRVWRECKHGWAVSMLEAAQRLEEGWEP